MIGEHGSFIELITVAKERVLVNINLISTITKKKDCLIINMENGSWFEVDLPFLDLQSLRVLNEYNGDFSQSKLDDIEIAELYSLIEETSSDISKIIKWHNNEVSDRLKIDRIEDLTQYYAISIRNHLLEKKAGAK